MTGGGSSGVDSIFGATFCGTFNQSGVAHTEATGASVFKLECLASAEVRSFSIASRKSWGSGSIFLSEACTATF